MALVDAPPFNPSLIQRRRGCRVAACAVKTRVYGLALMAVAYGTCDP